ncbi:MAG: hypothetical protein OXP09_04395 [Gammaproteobacteria bacterium]|nr:hypothetical protein [Gammaproteobacteria bacterium]
MDHKANAAAKRQVERLARQMYDETFERINEPRLGEVVRDKVTVMYGPPMVRPDLAIVSFQGGGGDRTQSARSWPERLLYLDDDFIFGRTLRRQCAEAGLGATLEKRTVAMAACFPEAPSNQAGLWMAKSGARAEWRAFSVSWVRRMLAAMSPRSVVVFGTKASRAMEMEGDWRDEQRDARSWRTFGRAELEGCPAIYCQHLSQGWKRDHVQMSLREAGCLIKRHDMGSGCWADDPGCILREKS